MKWIFGVICLTASLAAVSATFCNSADDCKEDHCCVGMTMSQMMKKGLCLKLTREKRQCNEPEAKHDYYGGKFMRYCPCAEGMVCEPSKPGVTDPGKRSKLLRCKKPSGTTTGPDITTASSIVTDDEIVDTTRDELVTDSEIITTPPEVTDDDIVDETLPPEVVTDETEAPEEETVETDAPEEETVETDAPEEETVETDAPEEETVETDAPEEETVETDAPEEETVETDAPEEETETPEEVVDENPEDEVVDENPEEAGQRGPGGERPRTDDPDCEDWTYGC